MHKIILASKSKVREQILRKNNIDCIVKPSNVDEDIVKINFPHIFTELKAANFGDIKEISIVINAKNTVNIAIRAHFI